MAKEMPKKGVEVKKEKMPEIITPKEYEEKILNPTKNSDGVRFSGRGKPSEAELGLIDVYKKKKGVGIVNNTLGEIIDESMDDIKEAIDNLYVYGDPKVFKTLPRDVNDKLKKLGVFAKEYFGKELRAMNGKPVYIVPTCMSHCNRCDKFKMKSEFFESNSDSTNGLACMCKKCSNELFNNYLKKYGVKEAILVMCQKLDYVVYDIILKKYVEKFDTPDGKQLVSEDMFFENFIADTNLNSKLGKIENEDTCFCKTNIGGVPFKNITPAKPTGSIYDDILSTPDGEEEEYGKYPSISKLKRKWGNFSKMDLYLLEDKFQEWYDKCEIDGLSREKLVMQLCFEELNITRARESGQNVEKITKNFQSLMKDAALAPKTAVSTSESAQYTSLGEFIKHAETNKPIIVTNPEFRDVDNFQRLWKSISGAIARTLGYENKYVDDFKEYYKEQTVDIQSINDSLENGDDKDGQTDKII